jgi:glycosyltransferase involved in cell wall biosynthesis
LDIAKGEWIGFMDSDDWAEPNMYAEFLDACLRNDCLTAFCSRFVNFADGRISYLGETDSKIYSISSDDYISGAFKGKFYFAVICRFYKSELWKAVRFPEDMRNAQDRPTLLPILEQVEKIAIINKPLLHYFIREDSMTQSLRTPQKIENIFKVFRAWFEYSENKGYIYHSDLMRSYLDIVFRDFSRMECYAQNFTEILNEALKLLSGNRKFIKGMKSWIKFYLCNWCIRHKSLGIFFFMESILKFRRKIKGSF